MNLKYYLQEHHISIYQLSKSTSIPYTSLHEVVNGKISANHVKCGIIKALSDQLGLTMENIYDMLQQDFLVHVGSHTGKVSLQNRQYIVSVLDQEEIVLYKTKIQETTTPFIKEIAEHEIDKYFKEKERDECVLRLHAEK